MLLQQPGNNFQKFVDELSAIIYTDFIQQKSEAFESTASLRDVNKVVNEDIFKQTAKMQERKQTRTTPELSRSHMTPAFFLEIFKHLLVGEKQVSKIKARFR